MQALDEILLEKCKTAKRVVAITGAGISAESGIPTFRGKDGYWKNYRAEDLANNQAFENNPKLIWEWYQMRMAICRKAEPNPGHLAMAEMESIFPEFHLITQNVDNLHNRAGSKNITELHGNIFTSRCTKCTFKTIQESDNFTLPPLCPKCNSILRPHILWFGETYDIKVLEKCREILNAADILLIVGTSGQVTVPVYLAEEAIRAGAYSIDINPEKSSLSQKVSIHLRGYSAKILPDLIMQLTEIR